jgi:hypothetical protein
MSRMVSISQNVLLRIKHCYETHVEALCAMRSAVQRRAHREGLQTRYLTDHGTSGCFHLVNVCVGGSRLELEEDLGCECQQCWVWSSCRLTDVVDRHAV